MVNEGLLRVIHFWRWVLWADRGPSRAVLARSTLAGAARLGWRF